MSKLTPSTVHAAVQRRLERDGMTVTQAISEMNVSRAAYYRMVAAAKAKRTVQWTPTLAMMAGWSLRPKRRKARAEPPAVRARR